MLAFIIFRDRVTYARRCLGELSAAGLEPVIVDHGSTWPEAVAWLAAAQEHGVTVLRRGGGHPRDMWDWAPFRAARGGAAKFVVTDPDVIPARCCPADWPARLAALLDSYPQVTKVGLGLRTDDLPAHYSRRQQVRSWERKFWTAGLGDGIYLAQTDTTLAMYRPGSGFMIDGAARTGWPYIADHLAWHENLERPSPEQAYYYAHAEPGIAHWAPRGRSAFGD